MARFRVKAYFMHEHEEQAARDAERAAVIQDAEWTSGFVMGLVDESKIKGLTEQGLVVAVVEEVVASASEETTALAMQPLTAGPAQFKKQLRQASSAPARQGRPVPVASEHQQSKQKVLDQDKRRTQFYVVRFHGPLTESRRAELNQIGIHPLERVSRNKFTVRLEPSEVKQLAELGFVDTIRLYTESDTLRIAPNESDEQSGTRATKSARRAAAQRSHSLRTRVYSVSVHRTQDMAAVVRWLKRKNHKPLAKDRNSFRVALPENSRILSELAALAEVSVVEPVETPRLLDDHARRLLNLHVLTGNPMDLEGDGEIIGIADTGIDISHDDFRNRIAGTSAWGRPGDVSDPDGHGTHVAGCAAGDGTASGGTVRGAAPRAKIFFQSILDQFGRLGGLPADLADLFQEAYEKGARIHNNSWGAFTFAQYTETAIQVDRFVAEHPDMLIVIAAGNDGIGVPRQAGATMNAANGFVDWPSVAAPATAKNGLTVGASRSSRRTGGYSGLTWGEVWEDDYPHRPLSAQKVSGDDQCLAAFSSRGPSNDLRVKPDVIAPGTDIAAAKSSTAPLRRFWGAYPGNSKYAIMGGTSMAAPYVAGCAALVREWYRKKAGWNTPSAALLKATLINGTQRIGGRCAVAPPVRRPELSPGFRPDRYGKHDSA